MLHGVYKKATASAHSRTRSTPELLACMPIEMYGASLIGKQVGVCVSTFKYWLLLTTSVVDIETLES